MLCALPVAFAPDFARISSLARPYGLASLPFYLIRGTRSLDEERVDISRSIARSREAYRSIQERYAKSYTRVSRRDQQELARLKKEEKRLSKQARTLNTH